MHPVYRYMGSGSETFVTSFGGLSFVNSRSAWKPEVGCSRDLVLLSLSLSKEVVYPDGKGY